MPCRGSGGLAWNSLGPLRTGFEAVIGTQQHDRFRTGELNQPLQHHIVKAIRAFHDIFVEIELFLIDPVELRRMIRHESVREMIDAIEVNRREIPRLGFHQCRRHRLDRGVIAQDFRKRFQLPVFFLIDLCRVGDERQNVGFG